MQYCGILLTRHTLYQTPALQKKTVDYEHRGRYHDLFAHIMHSWVGFELVQVFLASGLSPKLQNDLNNFSPDLFILFSYFGEKQRDSSKKEEAERLLQILFNKTEHSSYFGKLPFGKKTKITINGTYHYSVGHTDVATTT